MIRTVSKIVVVAVSAVTITTSSVHAQSPQFDVILLPVFENDGYDLVALRNDFSTTPEVAPKLRDLVRIEDKIEEKRKEDERVAVRSEKIRSYLASRGAPLADHAVTIVTAGEKYGVEPELIAAIAIVESGGGKINFRPYNAWGWMGHSFSSWEEAIDQYSKFIAEKYIAKGSNTPDKMARYYCPPTWRSWASKVKHVMEEIKR